MHSSGRQCDPPAYERYAQVDHYDDNDFHDGICRRWNINKRTAAVVAARKTQVFPGQVPVSAEELID